MSACYCCDGMWVLKTMADEERSTAAAGAGAGAGAVCMRAHAHRGQGYNMQRLSAGRRREREPTPYRLASTYHDTATWEALSPVCSVPGNTAMTTLIFCSAADSPARSQLPTAPHSCWLFFYLLARRRPSHVPNARF